MLAKYPDAELRGALSEAYTWHVVVQLRHAGKAELHSWGIASTMPKVSSLPEDDAAELRAMVQGVLRDRRAGLSMAERLDPDAPPFAPLRLGSATESEAVAAPLDAGRQSSTYSLLSSKYAEDAVAAERVRRAVLERSFGDLPAGSSYLDVGCGIGECVRLLADMDPSSSAFGTDNSPGMVEEARRRTPPQCGVHLMDFEQDDLPIGEVPVSGGEGDSQSTGVVQGGGTAVRGGGAAVASTVGLRWPASFDAVSGFAFLHMFPEARHRCVLRKMLRAATSRVLITTTEHAVVSEGMVPKEMGGQRVVRFRHRFTQPSLLGLAAECRPEGWRVRWWRMTDHLGKRWLGVLFYDPAAAGGDPDDAHACAAFDVGAWEELLE